VNDEHIVVGTVARLFRNKGYEQLIPAMVDTAAKDERLRFVWIGDGADHDSYLDQLSRGGISDRVMLTGLVPPDEVADSMQGFDILVHCSQWEGLPRTAVQALLLEIPTVSFAIDGAPEVVIDGETGKLVPLNDIRALSAAILRLAGNPQERRSMGRAGRARCLSMFNHHDMVDRLENLYRELLDSSG
jgi:glycosyltransferase involved in cell wall biosynthesis